MSPSEGRIRPARRRAASRASRSELWYFLQDNKKWWLAPIVISILGWDSWCYLVERRGALHLHLVPSPDRSAGGRPRGAHRRRAAAPAAGFARPPARTRLTQLCSRNSTQFPSGSSIIAISIAGRTFVRGWRFRRRRVLRWRRPRRGSRHSSSSTDSRYRRRGRRARACCRALSGTTILITLVPHSSSSFRRTASACRPGARGRARRGRTRTSRDRSW